MSEFILSRKNTAIFLLKLILFLFKNSFVKKVKRKNLGNLNKESLLK